MLTRRRHMSYVHLSVRGPQLDANLTVTATTYRAAAVLDADFREVESTSSGTAGWRAVLKISCPSG